MISHQVQVVIPAKAGIHWSAVLDTGPGSGSGVTFFRRCDEENWAICAQINARLNFVANQERLEFLHSLSVPDQQAIDLPVAGHRRADTGNHR